MRVPLVVMTSPVTEWVLPGFFHQLWVHGARYENLLSWCRPIVYGYDETNLELIPEKARDEFTSLGKFADYPANKWSNSFIAALNDLVVRGIESFWFMLDDYWICRSIDERGVIALYDYHLSHHTRVIKIDLAFDRLYGDQGRFAFYANGAGTVEHLDLIESDPLSAYHMSLWGGLFSTRLLLDLVRPGWTAQEVEMSGTTVLSRKPYAVLGTRQAPVLHTNVCSGRRVFAFGPPYISEEDMKTLRERGYTNGY